MQMYLLDNPYYRARAHAHAYVGGEERDGVEELEQGR